ncbi:MOSC domain-containing protein [Robbsia sp. Bb-Pol-6]|uniref:MOSC domain-containing protein n=1 Tax=Robbsia betulipollinis TaxID=2981849 RepID=A0ABT3ZM69_9BURK|nr:MOSC domain-containing protein [Robbsia betulipollinis]MCY0387048.1 MOSC domain-containing protein [Robbsia betulipollinis]
MPLNPESPIAKLMLAPVHPGKVVWLGLRAVRREPLRVVDTVAARAGNGLEGDRYGRVGGNRQVTLIQAESLAAIASHLGKDAVSPLDLRRNIVTSGINLLALKARRFRIGDAILEASGECHPCSRMEEILGTGGYNAVRGFGGITARVIEGGTIGLSSVIVPID